MKFNFGKTLDRRDSIPGKRQRGAKFALLVLTCINLLNFADRYVTSAVKELIKDDLNLTDAETALPTTGMVIVYVISAGFFGLLADKQYADRRHVLCAAIMFWSLATATAGLAQNLEQLVILRSLVGVGEAAYSTIAPPLIADFFPKRDRNIAFSIYFLAIPVGAALGFGIGAVLGDVFSWRVAFLGVGLPGIAASVCVLLCNNPVHGLNDPEYSDPLADGPDSSVALTTAQFSAYEGTGVTINPIAGECREGGDDGSSNSDSDSELIGTHSNQPISCTLASSERKNIVPSTSSTTARLRREIWTVLSSSIFLTATAGTVANNFALGGLAEWFPAYLSRFYDADIGESGLVVGAATILGGIGGCVLGAKTAQRFEPLVKSSFFLVCAVYTIPAALFLVILLNAIPSNMIAAAYVTLFATELFVWTSLAPMSTVALNAISPDLRGTSCGISIVLQHVLGDMISPPIIGGISDETGSLRTGLQVTWSMVLLSGVIWWAGYYFLPPLPVGMQSLSPPACSLACPGVDESGERSKVIPAETTIWELLFVRTSDDNR